MERNCLDWTPPDTDGIRGDETVDIIERVAAGSMTQEALASWVAERLHGSE